MRSKTVPESLMTIENQVRGYVNDERGYVFADMDVDCVIALCDYYSLVPVESPASGTWLCREDDLDEVAHIVSLERYASDLVLDDIRAEFLDYEISKTDIDIDSVMARDTIGSDGVVIKTELIDKTVKAPAENQRDITIYAAYARRMM